MAYRHARSKHGFRRRSLIALCAVMAVGTAACGSGGSPGGASDDTVDVTVLADVTGKAAFFGKAVKKSAEFSAKYVNDHGGMDGHKVTIDVQDTGSEPATAAQLMNKAISGGADAVIFGVLTEEALAIAPLAQEAKLPMVNVQAGGEGVTAVGDYIWRITPQQALFAPKFADYLAKEEGVKSAALFYATDNATSAELGKKVFPKAFDDAGIELTTQVAGSSSQTDLSGAASHLVEGKPDFILTLAIGAQNVTLITQLDRAGFKGSIGGGTALGAGTLSALPPSQSNGILYYSSFVGSKKLPYQSGVQFTKAYEAATGKQPVTFDAETYDAFGLIKQAVEKSSGISRTEIKKGMEEVASSGGFAAAQADPLTFKYRDAQSEGVVIEWRNGRETLAPGQ